MKRRTMIISAITSGVVVLGTAGIAVAATGGDDDDAPITGEALEQATAAALDHTGGGTVTETEVGDEDSYYEVEVTQDDGSQVDVQLAEDFTVVSVDEDDDAADDDGPEDEGTDADSDDAPVTGEALERATAAALDHTGGGTVTDTELDGTDGDGDGDGHYEVEVTRDDGTEVDVHLDENFAVVGTETDEQDAD